MLLGPILSAGSALRDYNTRKSPLPFIAEEGTPIKLISTIGILTIPRGTVINENYRFQVDLIAEVKFEDDKYLVADYQIDEYGMGNSIYEAQKDLFASLVDYLRSLEKRENRLGDRELRNLDILRRLLAK